MIQSLIAVLAAVFLTVEMAWQTWIEVFSFPFRSFTMSYVSKFEKRIPTEEIGVVIAAARGSETKRAGISAGLQALGCAAEFLPEDGPPPMMSAVADVKSKSDEECAATLEANLPAMNAHADDPKGAGGAFITIILPIVFDLLKRWLAK